MNRFFPTTYVALFILLTLVSSNNSWALASNNVPLDSPVYLYLEKLAGLGLISGDVTGIKPYSKGEVARLVREAEENAAVRTDKTAFMEQLLNRLRAIIPRETTLRDQPAAAPLIDYNPLSSMHLRYVYLDGIPRSFVRDVHDSSGQSAFGFIGGDLRPLGDIIVHTTGTEGTPLLENNEGVIYRKGSNYDLRWSMEGYIRDKMSILVEPKVLHTNENTVMDLQKAYLKLGGKGVELEIGRDANWFGPGYRGTTTLTSNARNFDLIKLSSPEPLDVPWVKKYVGDLKYALILSRFDETGTGADLRRPYFTAMKISAKPRPWFEWGFNFVRQLGGPGFQGESTLKEQIFGGGDNDHANTIAGIDLRFRVPWLRNTQIYGEYSGEDSAAFWPFVESYVAGIFVPDLTGNGRNDLRFEYFWGSVMLYGDWQFPAGYVYHGMTPGHSQGTAAQDFFVRYSYWFSVRNNLALEYFHTDRGKVGKMPGQRREAKDAVRSLWMLPLYEEIDARIMYGWERINNLNLVGGENRTNQIFKLDLSYRY